MQVSAAKCLFGGALVAAGVAASPAVADFEVDFGGGNIQAFENQSPYLFAYEGLFDVPGSISYIATSDWIDLDASAYVNYTGLGFSLGFGAGTMGADGFASVTSYMDVMVDTSTQIELLWDLFSLTAGKVSVYNSDTNTSVFSATESDAAGSMLITLEAGVNYSLKTSAQTVVFDQASSAFGTIQIVPAPGSIALLGFGGLVATKRRR